MGIGVFLIVQNIFNIAITPFYLRQLSFDIEYFTLISFTTKEHLLFRLFLNLLFVISLNRPLAFSKLLILSRDLPPPTLRVGGGGVLLYYGQSPKWKREEEFMF